MSKKIILTGDRPTGKLHLGHYVGSLKNRIKLQNEENTKMFVMIADQQALTDNADNPKKIIESVTEVALDYLAIGLNPAKTTIFIQSQIPQLAELTMYYMNLVSLARLQRNPTVKQELISKNFGESIPAGFLAYPISQAADITAFEATHVPVGEDQKPMLEQTREIVRDFNRIYQKEVLTLPEIVLPEKNQGRLIGIDGNGKMSKSLNNGIYLSDSPDEIKAKIMKMYTDPNHIRVEDPGQVKGNVVFTYLDIFDPNKEEVAELKAQYERGGLGDVKLKLRLNEIMQELLRPIRERREEFAKDKEEVYRILKLGSDNAKEVAAKTLDEVKDAMGINYFK
ncbi:tryptophan--tRNA ligase [Gemella sp. GH3]|uniref:tryptophan--tRNA ligase n=1 Tax=unclassified Gemella TaxID=2624949 RepID=UPI0015D049D3|nr:MULTISPECIES: tryptophan--tRNA ligase [unclassified Gemella]MBF0713520.1 tryptophan--tRNA ligase [Gemella sp. GH3.1]NYS50472.1 tryptophan--tRNA ligase [Gemella sp. GH3]